MNVIRQETDYALRLMALLSPQEGGELQSVSTRLLAQQADVSYEFACKILQEAGITGLQVSPIKTDQLIRPAERPHYSVLSIQKFIAATGKTMQPWQLALQDYLHDVRYQSSKN